MHLNCGCIGSTWCLSHIPKLWCSWSGGSPEQLLNNPWAAYNEKPRLKTSALAMLNVRRLPSCSMSFCLCLNVTSACSFQLNFPLWTFLIPWQSHSPLPLQHHPLCIECLYIHTVLTDPLQIFCLAASVSLSVQGESGTVYIWWSFRDRYALGWTWGFDSWDTDSTQSESSEVTRCPLVVAVTVTTAASNGQTLTASQHDLGSSALS